MISNKISEKITAGSGHRLIANIAFGLAAASLSLFWCQSAAAQLQDFHFRAGDGGMAASTLEEGINKPISNWRFNLINPDMVTVTYPGSSASPTFAAGTETIGRISGTNDGRISLVPGQASSGGGNGGNVVVDISNGQTIANSTPNRSRYFFTAGDGNAAGNGGDVVLNVNSFIMRFNSAFFFKSGLNGGGNNGGNVYFDVNTVTLGASSVPSMISFEEVAGGGNVSSSIGTLVGGSGANVVSYKGTSARYNTIGDIHFNQGAALTLYGKAGTRYDPGALFLFDWTANYTADGADIKVGADNSPTSTLSFSSYLNIQAGAIAASSLNFVGHLGDQFLSRQAIVRFALEINGPTINGSENPGLMAGETSLGKLDLSGLDKNDIQFSLSASALANNVGETYRLIQGNGYLDSVDYGIFARNFGAQMYLFDLNGSSGDLMMTYLGLDGGFTHYIKSYFQGRAATATTVVSGGQFLSDSVIANARRNAVLNMTTSSLTVGGSHIKTETGSDIDSDNYNVALSGNYLFELGSGEMLLGAFAEAGKSKYDTFHSYIPDAPQSNNGKADYFGGGAFARYEFPISRFDGFYAEASLRGGKIDNTFDSTFGNEDVSYDTFSSYYGAHLALGKVFAITEQTELDVYAKGFYNVVDGGGTQTSAKESLLFDKIESVTARVGTRLTHEVNDSVEFYVGGALEKELNGRVDGTYLNKDYGFDTKLTGNSGFGELGLKVQPLEIPLTVELNAFGKSGRQEGFGGSFSLRYTYF